MENKIRKLFIIFVVLVLNSNPLKSGDKKNESLMGYWLFKKNKPEEKYFDKYLRFGEEKGLKFMDYADVNVSRIEGIIFLCRSNYCETKLAGKNILIFEILHGNRIKILLSPLDVRKGGKDWERKPPKFYKVFPEGTVLHKDEHYVPERFFHLRKR